MNCASNPFCDINRSTQTTPAVRVKVRRVSKKGKTVIGKRRLANDAFAAEAWNMRGEQ